MTIDLANALADEYKEVVLMTGYLVSMQSELNPSVKICRIKKYNRKSSLSRAFSWIVASLQVLLYFKIRFRKHEVFFSSNPPTMVFVLLLINRPYSMIIWDLYPDALIAGKFINPNNPLVKVWSTVNKKVFAKARSLVTLTQRMASKLNQYVEKDKISIIPAWSSGYIYNTFSKDNNPFINKFQLNNKFIILYSGNLGKEHEIERLIEIADKLKDYGDIMVIIVGKGWKYDIIEKEIVNKQLSNCMLLPKQPSEMFLASLEAASIGVVSISSSASDVSIPSKTFNILAAGKPILCIGGENSDLSELLERTKTGAAFSASRIDEMASFICRLRNSEELYSDFSRNAIIASREFTSANAIQMVRLHKG